MHSLTIPQFGFLPSLEAMPLVEVLGGKGGWQMRPRTGCGSIIRSLLTGDLQAGLVPWELFITELLLQAGQEERWAVVQIIHVMPVELVLGATARKRLYPAKSGKTPTWNTRLTFAIEGRRSLAKFQFRSWLARFSPELTGKPLFRMLPTELMLKGLGENAIDGMIAPTPWGMQAEGVGVGRIDPDFEVGRFGQQIVMVCRRDLLAKCPGLLRELPSLTGLAQRRLMEDPAAFRAVVERMEMTGATGPAAALFEKASALYPWPARPVDFIPNAEWLMAELQNLVGLMLVSSDIGDVRRMAARLVFTPAARSMNWLLGGGGPPGDFASEIAE